MSGLTPLLAHQGGWDELLLFVVPALLAVGVLRWAEKRARAGSANPGTAEDEALPRPDRLDG